MARHSWFRQHHAQLGPSASMIEAFAAQYDNPVACERKIGRYVLWCLENGGGSAERGEAGVNQYLAVMALPEGNPLAYDTKKTAQNNIRSWQQALPRGTVAS